MANDSFETVPGDPGQGPQFIVPQVIVPPKRGAKIEDTEKDDPAPPIVGGEQGQGPMF
jgi:hypothetical protein